eukprot:2555687-Pleurochrysis_carterae.AAC.3
MSSIAWRVATRSVAAWLRVRLAMQLAEALTAARSRQPQYMRGRAAAPLPCVGVAGGIMASSGISGRRRKTRLLNYHTSEPANGFSLF